MLVRMAAVTKQYGGLRPLRIERLEIADGDRLAILGFDQPAAEVFVNLITGATLADAGEIAIETVVPNIYGDKAKNPSTLVVWHR